MYIFHQRNTLFFRKGDRKTVEIKINKEIKDIHERVYFGLTFRQMLYGALGLILGTLVFILFYGKIDTSYVGMISMLFTLPFWFLGFFRWQNMEAKDVIREFVNSYFYMKREVYNEPENVYADMLKAIRYNDPLMVKKRQKQVKKKMFFSLVIILLLVFTLVMSIKTQRENKAELMKEECFISFTKEFDDSFYLKSQRPKLAIYRNILKYRLSQCGDTDEIQRITKEIFDEAGKLPDKADAAAALYEKNWGAVEHVRDLESLSNILREEKEKIRKSDKKSFTIVVFSADMRMKNTLKRSFGKRYDISTLRSIYLLEGGNND